MDGKRLVKTVKFDNPRYLGDPINSLRIFNNKGVDELCLLDIRASLKNNEPNFDYLKEIASEAFMPLSYGGGIKSISHVKKLLHMGFEKVIFNSNFMSDIDLIKEAVSFAGGQSVVLSIDAKKDIFGKYHIYTKSGTSRIKNSIEEVVSIAEAIGVGEILVNAINNDGTMLGYDLDLLRIVSEKTKIPVVICGGASCINDLKLALDAGAHGVAAGSLFVYYGKQRGVLINFPSDEELFKARIY